MKRDDIEKHEVHNSCQPNVVARLASGLGNAGWGGLVAETSRDEEPAGTLANACVVAWASKHGARNPMSGVLTQDDDDVGVGEVRVGHHDRFTD